MADAKEKSGAEAEEQSMEEILQSIRKIIAEEGDAPTEEPMEEAGVLELTDMIQEDGSIVNISAAQTDVLNKIDAALSANDPELVTPPESVVVPEPEPEPELPAVVIPVAIEFDNPPASEVPALTVEEGLLSAASIAASTEALRALTQPKPVVKDMGHLHFVSENTVEGLMMQLLRPMLKEWLDANLPGIVQGTVEREVRRITSALEK